MDSKEITKTAYRVSAVTAAVNIILSLFKLAAGVISSSGAMISDAVHSASDVAGTFIAAIGIKMSAKAPDKDHQYGHDRFECVSALILSAVLFATGAGIGFSGIRKIIGGAGEIPTPGALALCAAALSIVVKEAVYRYTMRAARKISSSAMKADAWHQRSDALSSVGSFIGILGARMGVKILDPIAAVVICVFIMKTALDIFTESVGKMTDRACDDSTVDMMREIILSQEGVMSVDELKTRIFGDGVYVEVEIGVARDTVLEAAHEISSRVHDAIEGSSDKIKHCMVHVNPK